MPQLVSWRRVCITKLCQSTASLFVSGALPGARAFQRAELLLVAVCILSLCKAEMSFKLLAWLQLIAWCWAEEGSAYRPIPSAETSHLVLCPDWLLFTAWFSLQLRFLAVQAESRYCRAGRRLRASLPHLCVRALGTCKQLPGGIQ